MKGIVFTELIEMVEDRFGLKVADEIIQNGKFDHNGAYTGVGTYPHKELVTLVNGLSESTGIPVNDLYRVFGEHLFNRFTVLYGQFFDTNTTAFDFLESIDIYIHKQVLKLYPDAELPKFTTIEKTEHLMVMIYQSERRMSEFAYGLLIGCFKHFEVEAEIKMTDLGDNKVEFRITKVG